MQTSLPTLPFPYSPLKANELHKMLLVYSTNYLLKQSTHTRYLTQFKQIEKINKEKTILSKLGKDYFMKQNLLNL